MKVVRALPGPAALAAWFLATVPWPLVFFEWTHRWEEDQPVSTAVWWAVGAAPLLAAAVAARWRGGGRRDFVAAEVAATLVGAVFLCGSLAVFRWVIPLSGSADWPALVLGGVLAAACGGAVGCLVRFRPRRGSRRRGYVVGALVAVAGALVMQTTVRLGAEGSTIGPELGAGYGGVGPYTTSAADQGMLTLPAAGGYAIYAVGFAPADPDCRVDGGGAVERVTIPPGDYGGDFATYTWVAVLDVPAAGNYAMTCQSSDDQASYMVGDIPRIQGLVGSMIHWPLIAILLLGAVPGLLIVADAATRRTRSRSAA